MDGSLLAPAPTRTVVQSARLVLGLFKLRIGHTRAMVKAALSGALDNVGFETDPVFNLAVPLECPGVPHGILRPKATWADQSAYDEQAAKLAGMFVENFRTFASGVGSKVVAAGPRA